MVVGLWGREMMRTDCMCIRERLFLIAVYFATVLLLRGVHDLEAR